MIRLSLGRCAGVQVLGAGYDCNLAGCAVPAIHSAHESFFQATPGYIGVRDDLQEGHVYDKLL